MLDHVISFAEVASCCIIFLQYIPFLTMLLFTQRERIYNVKYFNLLSRYVMDWCLVFVPEDRYSLRRATIHESRLCFLEFVTTGGLKGAIVYVLKSAYTASPTPCGLLWYPLFSFSHPTVITAVTNIYRGTVCGCRHCWGGGVYGYICCCAWWGGWRWQRQWCRKGHINRYACECWQQVLLSAAAAATIMHCCHGRLFPPWAVILVPRKGRLGRSGV